MLQIYIYRILKLESIFKISNSINYGNTESHNLIEHKYGDNRF